MRMTYQPNRPVRVGSKLVMTDENGNLPQEKAKQDEKPALSGMTKAELIATAEAESVDLSDASNNDERIAAIEASRAS